MYDLFFVVISILSSVIFFSRLMVCTKEYTCISIIYNHIMEEHHSNDSDNFSLSDWGFFDHGII